MTVQELIDILKAHPPGAKVMLVDWSEGAYKPIALEAKDIALNEGVVELGPDWWAN